jgi:hypothetical protein
MDGGTTVKITKNAAYAFSASLLMGLLAVAPVSRLFSQQPAVSQQPAPAQPPAAGRGFTPPPPVPNGNPLTTNWTTNDDHRNMMDQLGIKALRPGPSGTETAPDHANYDESKANPFPDYPDALTLKNGKKVTSAKVWWSERRPEIVEDFEREVLGRVPKDVPKVTWTVTRTANAKVGDYPVVAKLLVGHVDNSSYPAITVDIHMALVLPANARKPVPVMMMFGGGSSLPGDPLPARGGFGAFGGRAGAAPGAAAGRGAAPGAAPGATAVAGAPGAAPGAPAAAGAPGAAAGRGPAGLAGMMGTDPPAQQQLLADGWGYAQIDPSSIQADNGAGLTRGIIGLVNKGNPRKPDDWGSLMAWGWGAGRGLDYLETDKAVDAKHVGIEGVSRYGKAALVTMAFDQRFAVVLIGSSGEGGAKPHRRNWGEAVENLTGSGEYHWMAGNFLKYGASQATFGSKNAGDIPVDSNELIALCAPRLTFVSYGVPEKGDAKWLDHQGSFMAAVDAGAVFRLLGAKDLGVKEDYRAAKMPPVLTGLLNGQLAWRQHDGGHTDAPNWKYFIPWADKFWHRTPPAPVKTAARKEATKS